MMFRRLLFAALLLLAGLHLVQPLAAFDSASVQMRSVGAAIVADPVAYVAIAPDACSVSTDGGSCTFTITNRGNYDREYRVALTGDAGGVVSSYALTGSGSVASGWVASPSAIAVGSSTTLTATVDACPACSGASYDTYWSIRGEQGGVLMAERVNFLFTIQYA